MIDILPEKLYLTGSFDEIISRLYCVFVSDIKKYDLRYRNLPIIFDSNKIDSEYEEGFWHIITRGKDERYIDFKRAKRIPWIKPIIENSDHQNIVKWIESDVDRKGKKIIKTYIWYREGKYLLVLKEIPRRYFLTTAFYVNGQRNDKYYYDKYNKAKKRDPSINRPLSSFYHR
jgi:hypothetical protein